MSEFFNVNEHLVNKFVRICHRFEYVNDECMLLNALDFGEPQDRERAFIVSHLGSKLDIESKLIKKERKYKFDKFFRNDYTNPTIKAEADIAQLYRTPSREQMWRINGRELNENTVVRTITCNMDRTHTAALFKYEGIKGDSYRRLTLREAFLMMGFNKEEYLRAASLGFSYRKLNKLIGNSIVVNVLVAIFEAMFEEKYKKEN